MKQPMKKLLSLVLASSMVLGMATTAQAAFQDFTDVKGHWAEATLQQAYEDGILQGSSTTTMAPFGLAGRNRELYGERRAPYHNSLLLFKQKARFCR